MMIHHFSHRHPLTQFQVNGDHGGDDVEEERAICSGCELELELLPDSAAYKCEKPGCDFHLHVACYELPRDIRHGSHARHALSLLFAPPQSFSCAACGGSGGTAFAYACPTCPFGLHVGCSALPNSVSRDDLHPHALSLVDSLPDKKGREDRSCGICGRGFAERCWAYFCGDCGYIAHLECAIPDDEEEELDLSGIGETEGKQESGETEGKQESGETQKPVAT